MFHFYKLKIKGFGKMLKLYRKIDMQIKIISSKLNPLLGDV
jgi:hypothetical protein